VTYTADNQENKLTLSSNASFGGLQTGQFKDAPLPPSIGKFTLSFDDNSMEELWLALTWASEIHA
jgi:hypothetical protein